MVSFLQSLRDRSQDSALALPWTESILFGLAGSVILLLGRLYYEYLNPNPANEFTTEPIYDLLFNLSDGIIVSQTMYTMLWLCIGAGIYLLLWGLIVFVIDLLNDIIISSAFTHPKSFHQSEYWLAIAGRFFIRVSALLMLATITLLIIVLTPHWFRSGYGIGGALGLTKSILLFVGVSVVTYLLLYLSVIALRIFFLRRRLYQ